MFRNLKYNAPQNWLISLGDASGLEALALSPNGATLVCRESNNTLRIYDTHTKHEETILWSEANGNINATFSSDSKIMAISDADWVYLYDAITSKHLRDIKFK